MLKYLIIQQIQTIRLYFFMRREFNASYDEAISLIKQLKNSNDYLNRACGVQSPTTIALRIKREHNIIEQTLQKIESLIQKLEQSYLDPDTARKIGTIKQQFRIQKDRRKQLLQSVQAETKNQKYLDRGSKDSQMTTFSSLSVENPRRNTNEGWSRQNQRHQQAGHKSIREQASRQQDYQELGVNFEIEHKIMRQKNAQINTVSKSLMNVHSIMQQTSNLTFEQGQKLDIIGEDLFESYRNVREARQNINEANEHQKRAKRKYIYFSLMVLLGVAVALIILLL